MNPIGVFCCLLLLAGLADREVVPRSESGTFSGEIEFADGVYFTAEEFRHNNPALSLDSIDFSERPSSGGHRRYFYGFDCAQGHKDARSRIWGICVDGVPYINQSRLAFHEIWYNEPYLSEDTRGLEGHGEKPLTFVRIMYIGHLCHFTLEYIPTFGVAPIDMTLDRRLGSQTNFKQKVLKVSTGEIRDFKAADFEGLIADDAMIHEEFLATRPGKRARKIFEWFHLYNSRNELSL